MIAILPQHRHRIVTGFALFQPSRYLFVKKLPPVLLVILGLYFSGCAMTVPLNPALLMLLKDDGPPPKLEIVPQTNQPQPANLSPAQVAQDQAAVMG